MTLVLVYILLNFGGINDLLNLVLFYNSVFLFVYSSAVGPYLPRSEFFFILFCPSFKLSHRHSLTLKVKCLVYVVTELSSP